jgi:hypothetical protein
LVIDKYGLPDMMVTDSETDLTDIGLAVGGCSFCLVNGEPKTLHPGTDYGLSAET